MLPLNFLYAAWHRGDRAEYIEDMTSRYLEEFAPYAGAEHQQLSLTRVHRDSGVVMSFSAEEKGHGTALCRHPSIGVLTCATAGQGESQATLRVPLLLPTRTRAGPSEPYSSWNLRYGHHLSPFRPLYPVQCVGPSPVAPVPLLDFGAAVGELQLEGSVPHPELQRHVLGLRIGPVALRAVRAPQHSSTDSSGDSSGLKALPTHAVHAEANTCVRFRRSSKDNKLFCGLQWPVAGGGDALLSVALETERFRALVVQTLFTVRPDFRHNSLNSSTTQMLSSLETWREMPTLVSGGVTLHKDVLQLHVASMLQRAASEVEVGASVQLSALTPLLSGTVVRSSINDRRRVGVGITTALGEFVQVTLGLHKERGAGLKFGLSFQC